MRRVGRLDRGCVRVDGRNTMLNNETPVENAVVTAAPKPKSKYTLVDVPGGFLVQREGGLEVGVTYGETYIHVGNKNVGLYQYPQVVDAVGEWFMDHLVTGYLNKRKAKE